jgi:hypothetical protein
MIPNIARVSKVHNTKEKSDDYFDEQAKVLSTTAAILQASEVLDEFSWSEN